MSPAPHDRFQQLECIGRGSYGEVYRGIDKATGVPVALKVVELEDIDDDIESMHKEILTLAGCRSKNITDYYTSFLIPGTSQLCIAMELMACSVVDLIRVGELDERSIAYVLKETLQALDYLHSQNRIHR